MTDRKWLFDIEKFGDILGHCMHEADSWDDLHEFVQSEIIRNRRETREEFYKKLEITDDGTENGYQLLGQLYARDSEL